jgi:hypothetical protein
MSLADDLAALFYRDLTRVLQQVHAFGGQDVFWECAPGIANSSGNLVLHLEGNLREYVGRVLGNLPYRRVRDEEFGSRNVSLDAMIGRIEDVRRVVPEVIRQLSDVQLQSVFPGNPLGSAMSTQQFLIHLSGHLQYHLGQIDYQRRVLTGGGTIAYAGL